MVLSRVQTFQPTAPHSSHASAHEHITHTWVSVDRIDVETHDVRTYSYDKLQFITSRKTEDDTYSPLENLPAWQYLGTH